MAGGSREAVAHRRPRVRPGLPGAADPIGTAPDPGIQPPPEILATGTRSGPRWSVSPAARVLGSLVTPPASLGRSSSRLASRTHRHRPAPASPSSEGRESHKSRRARPTVRQSPAPISDRHDTCPGSKVYSKAHGALCGQDNGQSHRRCTLARTRRAGALARLTRRHKPTTHHAMVTRPLRRAAVALGQEGTAGPSRGGSVGEQ